MSKISLDLIREVQSMHGSSQEDRKISYDLIKEVQGISQSKSFAKLLSGAESWSSPSKMDTYIQAAKDVFSSYGAKEEDYSSLINQLNQQKTLYGKYKTADEYNTAVKQSGYLNKYEGYTPQQIRKSAADLEQVQQRKSQRGQDTAELDDELTWLRNYSTDVGYSDSKSYDEEIKLIQEEIDRYNAQYNDYIYKGVGVTGPADTQNEAKPLTAAEVKFSDYLGERILELKTKKTYLEQQRNIVAAQEKLKDYRVQYVRLRDFWPNAAYKPEYEAQTETWIDDNSGKEYSYNEHEEYLVVNQKADAATDREKLLGQLSEEQVAIYNYLYHTQGKENATAFVDDILPLLNVEYAEDQAEKMEPIADIPFVSSIASLGTNLLDTFAAPKKFIGSLTGDYKKYGAVYDTLSTATNTFRQADAERLDKLFGTEESGIAGTIYSGVMSLADMGVSIGVGGFVGKVAGAAAGVTNTAKVAQNVTQVIMSSQAASQSMLDARQRGLSGIQIVVVGAGSAAAEWLTEKYALDELFEVPPKLWRTVLSEGVSEGASNVLNTAWDLAISGDKASMKLQVGKLMADGKSYEDAVQTVVADKLSEIGVESLIGAFSGGIAGSVAIGIDKAKHIRFSVPKKYAGSDTEAIQWSADAFKKQKNTAAVKGLGTVSIDAATATNAIENAKTTDQALALVALNKSLRLGKVVAADGAATARIVTPVALNGKGHILTAYATKTADGKYTVSVVLLDGDVIYDDAAKTTNTQEKEKFSIASFADGKAYVDVETDQELFDGLSPQEMRKVAVKTIKDKFRGKVLGDNRAFVKSESASEYGYPSRFIKDDNIVEAKMRASTELDNLVEAADNHRNEPDGGDGHIHKEATGGFDKYDVTFKVANRYYQGEVVVTVTDKGKVFKDVTKIRDITDDIIAQYGENPQGNFANDTSNNRVSQNQPAVNNQSMQNAEDYVAGLHEYGMIGMEPSALDQQFMAMDEQAKADFISRMERATGTKIVFDENMDAQGRYKDGVITINPKTATPMLVLKHELTHFIEKSGSYGELMRFVLKSQLFSEWLGGKTLGELRTEKINLYAEHGVRLEPYEANQEIFADFIAERVLRDMNAMTELAEHRGFFQKLKDWFMGIVRHFTDSPQQKELRQIEQMFSKAVRERKNIGIQNGHTETIKFSLMNAKSFKDNVLNILNMSDEEAIRNKEQGNFIQVMGSTPAVIIQNIKQASDLPIIIRFDALYLAAREQGVLAGHYHNLGENLANELPKCLENPDAIVMMDNGRLVLLSRINHAKGNNDVVSVEMNTVKDINNKNSKYNLVVTVIPAKDNYVRNTIRNHGMKVAYEKEGLPQVNPQLHEWLATINDKPSIDPIKPQNGDGVNTQYTQDGEKYSFAPTLDIAEDLLDQYENGEISREEYLERLNSRQHKGNPLTYAQLTPEDANTTPHIDSKLDFEGKSNRKGDGQSLFAESLQGAEIFDSRLKELAATDNAISRYDRIADMELMEEANRTINEGGAEFVTEWFSKKFDKSFTPKDVAIGYILMSRYQAVGDYYHAVKAAEKLREIATRSGQTVQMFAVLNRLTPEGMLLYAQRELDAAFEVIAKKRTRRWMLENEHLFKLTDAEQEFILNCVWDAAQLPDGRDKDIALAHISGLIQSKIPHENGQAFKALQRMSMLLNPKTNLRNIFGNVTITPQQIVSDIIGAGIDKATAAAFKTGVRVKTLPQVSAVKGWWKGVRESFDDFRRSAKAGYKIDTRKTGMDRFDIQGVASNNFNEHHTGKWAWLNPISKKLNAVDRFCSFLLDLGDRPFFEMWFMNSIEGQKKANHVTEATPEMIEIATLEGMQRTWQDENLMTKLVGTIKGAGNKAVNIHGYGLGDVAIKFSKTPANLAKAMIEFSPAGIAKALAVDFAKFKNALDKGEATASMQHHFVKTLSNGITGTLTMMAFATLISRGIIKATGKQDDDRDVADFERYVLGIQPYSIQIGGKSYSYDWAQPTAAQLAIVADYLQNKESAELAGEELDLFNSITSALTTAGSALYDQSFMQSIRTIMEEDDGFTALYKAILSDISANVPMLSSQFASTLDDTVRTTYEYGDEWQTAVNKVKYKIPGARNTLAPAVDVMGNEKKQVNDIWHSFFSPANVAEGYESKAADEVYRLYQETGEASAIPSLAPNYVSKKGGKYTLSSHEKAEYQTVTGSIATEAVENLLTSDGYKALSDGSKVELLSTVYSYAKQAANKEILGLELDESSAKAQTFIDQGIPVWQYFLLKKTADTNDNIVVSQDEAKAVLDASTLTKSQKEIMWMAFSPTGKSAWKSNPYKKRYY